MRQVNVGSYVVMVTLYLDTVLRAYLVIFQIFIIIN
jgi:hypothetical protein